jgi:hypothetical protein
MMVKYPKVGMKYEQAKKTAIRHGKEGSVHLVNSMTNQVRLAEGNKAAAEFHKEVIAKSKYRG